MKPRSLGDDVNIKRVAREAGVSTQTVSRVINNRPDVAPETRERVQAVVNRLGYRPSALARGLIARRTHTLGVITNSFNDFFFMQVISGAEAEARARGYRLTISSAAADETTAQAYERLLGERYVEGMLIVRHGDEQTHAALRDLARQGIPMATTAVYQPDTPLTIVDVDNVAGAYQAVRYLCEHGHHAIAQITGPLGMQAAADRVAGYQRALTEFGISPHPALTVEGGWNYQSGYIAGKELLARNMVFSALFAQNDEMAIGAMFALREAGFAIPQDVSVIGYDDIPASAYSMPPLTTVRQPIAEIGRLATQVLIQRIEGDDVAPGTTLLQTELVVRASVQPAINRKP